MSAYIVDPSTVNRIVSYIEDLCARGSQYAEDSIRREFADAIGCPPYGDAFFYELGLAMMKLNVDAVKQRYPNDADDALPGPIGFRLDEYRYQPKHARSRIEVYKSLQCWLYQCSEGDVPERPLYKAMNEFARDLAEEIVCDLPEYERAVWG